MGKPFAVIIALAGCLLAWAAPARAGYITGAQLNDVTAKVRVASTTFEARWRTSQGLVLIHQPAFWTGRIDGSVVVVLRNLTPGVTLLNADGVVDGSPYVYLPRGLGFLASAVVPVRFDNPGRVKIAFTPVVNQLVAGAVEARAVRALTRPFTIAAIPDTQFYADEKLEGFKEQVSWVLANAAARNIAFVTQLGDVVDNGTDVLQWQWSMAALQPLLTQAALPFSIVRGNHDEPGYFLANLPVSTMAAKPWFVDASPSGLAQAQVFRVEGAVFLHLGLEKDPTADELAWANTLLARPELEGVPVILSTHDYIDGSGQSPTGRIIWQELVRGNPSIFMVLNGHTHTEYAVINHDAANRPVYQMLSDYQDRAFGGNGLMRLVTVDPAASKIVVKTFSPLFRVDKKDPIPDYYETDADSDFTFDVLDLRERLAYDTILDFGQEPAAPPLPVLAPIPASIPYTHVFQNRRPLVGTATPYLGTVDVQINENNPTLDYGGEATLTTDNDDSGSRVHAMLRFDGIVGAGPGQIPPGARIRSARLVFNATSSTKGKVKLHRLLVPWAEHSSWMDFTPVNPATGLPDWTSLTYLNTDTGIYKEITLNVMVGGGLQADDVEAASAVDATFTMPKPFPTPFVLEPGGYGTVYTPPAASGLPPEPLAVDLTTTVQAWVDGAAANWGWFFEPTSSDGWDFQTAEGKQPPALVVEVEGFAPVQ